MISGTNKKCTSSSKLYQLTLEEIKRNQSRDSMAINHFSHEHKLNLEEVKLKARVKVKCEVCDEHTSSSEEAYCCRICKFFLHQVCAEYPREITHIMHPQHPLRLKKMRGYGTPCDNCREYVTSYVYNCTLCYFNLDLECALPEQTRNYDHIHHHPLTFQKRPATFICNFCWLEDKDQSYKCYKCQFWIHKKCASMPLTNQLNFHPHPVSLVQGMPEELVAYKVGCVVCYEIPWPTTWLYYCGPCRYFIDLKCMKVMNDQIEAYYSLRDWDDFIDDSFFKYIFNENLLHLPADNIAVDLIQKFLVEKNSLIDIQHEIQDFSHKQHPLILITEQIVNNDNYFQEEDEEILCDGCIEPITAPYYCCAECKHYLHVPCAHLPSTIQHPGHSHELDLSRLYKFYSSFHCNHCLKYTNGYCYGCDDCNFYLDLKCAALPNIIMHDTHEHPLTEENASGDELCDAYCNDRSVKEGNPIFKCKSCDINFHNSCATLPRGFRHRWDRNHPIRLRFPPHYEHPDHIMCDMCEEIIDPQDWLYSCFKCKVSFHPNCPPRLCKDPNIKYGGEVQISTHSHPLKYLRQATLKTSCDACEDDLIEQDDVFECETCYTCMCYICVANQLS